MVSERGAPADESCSWEPLPGELLERARDRWAAARRGNLGPMFERSAAECEVRPRVVRVVEGEAGVFRGHDACASSG